MIIFISWILTFIWMGLIFMASSMQFEPGPPLFPGDDKVIHFIEYGILSSLFYNALTRSINKINIQNLVFPLAVLFSVLYGITDEIHQLFVPTRSFSVYDMLADLLGSFVFCYIIHSYIYKRRLKIKSQ